MGTIALGIALNICGSLTINLGTILMKRGHIAREKDAKIGEEKKVFKYRVCVRATPFVVSEI